MPQSRESGRGRGQAIDRILPIAVAVVAVAVVAVGFATWRLLPRKDQAPKSAYARALDQAEKAVAASPKKVMPRLELANVYFTYKDYDAAVEEIEKARSIETTVARDKALIEMSFARVYDVKGDAAAAKRHYEAALKHEKSFDAYYALGVLHQKAGDAGGAIADWESALEQNPNAATLRIELAKLLVKAGRKDDAVLQLKDAQRYLPGDPDLERLLTEVSRGE